MQRTSAGKSASDLTSAQAAATGMELEERMERSKGKEGRRRQHSEDISMRGNECSVCLQQCMCVPSACSGDCQSVNHVKRDLSRTFHLQNRRGRRTETVRVHVCACLSD